MVSAKARKAAMSANVSGLVAVSAHTTTPHTELASDVEGWDGRCAASPNVVLARSAMGRPVVPACLRQLDDRMA